MKKLIGLFVVVGILSGCGGQNESSEPIEQKVASESIVKEESGKYDRYQVKKTEYFSLDEFMNQQAEILNNESADVRHSGFVLLHYINYFEDEIESIRMAKEFGELQDIAYAVFHNDDESQALFDKYKSKFYEVYEIFSQK